MARVPVTKRDARPSAGECCPVIKLALARSPRQRLGLSVPMMFNLKTGQSTGERLVYEFRKAKRGEEGEFGAKSEFAASSYAVCQFCPFCGAKQP